MPLAARTKRITRREAAWLTLRGGGDMGPLVHGVSEGMGCRTALIEVDRSLGRCPIPKRAKVSTILAAMTPCVKRSDLGCALCCIYRGII